MNLRYGKCDLCRTICKAKAIIFFLEHLYSTKSDFRLACLWLYKVALTLERKLTYQCIAMIFVKQANNIFGNLSAYDS